MNNNKLRTCLFAVSAGLSLLLAGCSASQNNVVNGADTLAEKVPQIRTSMPESFEVNPVGLKGKKNRCVSEFKYPEVTPLMKNKKAAKSINQYLKQNFGKMPKEWAKYKGDDAAMQNYQVLNRSNYLSISMSRYSSPASAEHGKSLCLILNFNPDTGALISIDDVTGKKTDFLGLLTKKLIEKRTSVTGLAYKDLKEAGFSVEKIEKIDQFALKESAIKFYFNEGLIAPNEMGPIEIEIPMGIL